MINLIGPRAEQKKASIPSSSVLLISLCISWILFVNGVVVVVFVVVDAAATARTSATRCMSMAIIKHAKT